MINEFIVLLAWVCIIESQIRVTTIGLSNLEVKADGLGVTNVQVTIRLGRESCVHFTASKSSVLFQDLSGVADIYITTDELTDVNLVLLFLLFFFLSSCFRCCFLLSLILLLAELFALSVTGRGFSDEGDTLGIDLVANHCTIGPLE